MALQFLTGLDVQGNINLSKNELQNAVVQNLAVAPGTPLAGQIYFDTVLDKLRLYDGTSWLTVPDGNTAANDFLTGLAFNTSNGVLTATVSNQANVTVDLDGRYAQGTIGNGTLTVQGTGVLGGTGTFTANQSGNTTISVTHDTVSRTDTTSAVSSNTFTSVDSVTSTAEGHITALNLKTVTVPAGADTTYELFGVGSTNGTAGIQLDGDDGTLDNVLIVGAGTSSVTRAGNVLTVTSNDQFDGTVTSVIAGTGMTQSGTSTLNPTLNVIGGSGITANANDIEVDGTVVRTTNNQTIAGTKTFTSNIVVPVTPTLAANAASKSYVDSTLAGSGALIFQGGYNAATNTPDLDVSPSASIKQGWTYAVTTAGNFFAEAVEDGDLLIAESDAPTSLADWTVVQNNVSFATATVKGIANFPTAGGLTVATGAVSMPNVGTPTGSLGGPTTSLNISTDNKGRVTAVSKQNIAIPSTQITDFCTAVETCISDASEFTTTIGNGTLLTHTVNHNLDSKVVMVQLYDTSSGETVNATVVRTTLDDITVSTSKPIANGDVTVMIKRIQ